MDRFPDLDRIQRQLADMDRLKDLTSSAQRSLEQFQKFPKHLRDLRGADHLVAEAQRQQEQLSKLGRDASHALGLDAASRRFDQLSRIERDIQRFQETEKRIRDWDQTQKRIADFEASQRRLHEFDNLQRSLRRMHDEFAGLSQAERWQRNVSLFDPLEAERRREAIRAASALGPASAASMRNGLDSFQRSASIASSFTPADFASITDRISSIRERAGGLGFVAPTSRQMEIWESINARARDTFVGELTATVRSAVVDAVTDEEAVEKVAELVAAKLEQLPQNGYTRQELVNLVFGILSLLLALYSGVLATYQFFDSKKSGDEQKATAEKIVKLMEKLVENTAAESPNDGYPIYVAERDAQVKTRPQFRSTTVDILPKGARVRVLRENHKWVFVEYLDSLELQPRMGWVSKKYLKRLG